MPKNGSWKNLPSFGKPVSKTQLPLFNILFENETVHADFIPKTLEKHHPCIGVTWLIGTNGSGLLESNDVSRYFKEGQWESPGNHCVALGKPSACEHTFFYGFATFPFTILCARNTSVFFFRSGQRVIIYIPFRWCTHTHWISKLRKVIPDNRKNGGVLSPQTRGSLNIASLDHIGIWARFSRQAYQRYASEKYGTELWK